MYICIDKLMEYLYVFVLVVDVDIQDTDAIETFMSNSHEMLCEFYARITSFSVCCLL
jgi:hypothetical protein